MHKRGRPRHDDVLTPREWQVLHLLREGLTNEQIAVRLGISHSGAKYHVAEILGKLEVDSREAAAAWRPEPARSRAFRFVSLLAPLKYFVSGKAVVGLAAAGAAAGFVLAINAFAGQAETLPPVTGIEAGKLAYVQDGDLWVRDLSQASAHRLTSDGEAMYPQWSHSGDWLVSSEEVMRADGSARRDAPGCYAWSPAADRLACTTADFKVRVEDADGSNRFEFDPAALVPDIDRDAITRLGITWSPDGQTLAYVLDAKLANPRGVPGKSAPDPTRYSGLWTAHPDGTAARELLNNQTHPEAGQIAVFDWSVHGMVLLFNPFFSASIPNDGLPLHLLPLDGSPPRELDEVSLPRGELYGGFSSAGSLALTEGGGRQTWTRKRIAIVDPVTASLGYLSGAETASFSPAWSPDGRTLAYVSAPDIGAVGGGEPARLGMAQRHIWLLDTRMASTPRQLTDDPAYRDERPQWSADGSHILFTRLDVEDRTSLWLVAASGGEPTKLADISRPPSPQAAPLWFGFYGYIAWDQYFDWWQP